MSTISFRCKILDKGRLRIFTVQMHKHLTADRIIDYMDDVLDPDGKLDNLHAVQIVSIERVEPTD